MVSTHHKGLNNAAGLFTADLCISLSASWLGRRCSLPRGPSPSRSARWHPTSRMKGATRYGVLATPIHLSDFKGKTVVLAFFYKARTRG